LHDRQDIFRAAALKDEMKRSLDAIEAETVHAIGNARCPPPDQG
jgi:hypothetical protein